jgi:hypothetical protein
MPAPGRAQDVRERVRRVLAALRPEDLEERIAPVKCNKHPDSIECATDYGVPRYAVPEYGTPPPEGGP